LGAIAQSLASAFYYFWLKVVGDSQSDSSAFHGAKVRHYKNEFSLRVTLQNSQLQFVVLPPDFDRIFYVWKYSLQFEDAWTVKVLVYAYLHY
jgi:hypothetical protein